MTKTSKIKLRTTYPKEIRAKAKAERKGVATISIEFPNGERMETQGPVDHLQCEFLRWASVMMFCDELPDLHDIVKELVDGSR